ncbi:aldehyde dehydrogenase family protein [Streptomyces sp. NPDC057424]|uniref:aldehyde dehydrogenase family protein n=1 Tax=Streptomyces sp. NPDC057424 TaxID=3346127 RepID=UPI00368048F0
MHRTTAPGTQDRDLPLTQDARGKAVQLFRRGRWYASLDSTALCAVSGLRVCLAPPILIRDDARYLRDHLADTPAPTPGARRVILSAALDLFAHGRLDLGGIGLQDAAAFRSELDALTGIPPALVTRWCRALRTQLDALPTTEPDDALTLVSLPGNTFTTLESVFEAVLTSGAVWIRPSRKEPLSAARFAAALLRAGWPPERLGLYPTEPHALSQLVTQSDRQIIYGGEAVARTFGALPTVSLRGPCRACAVVDPQEDVRLTARRLRGWLASDAGRFCTTVHTVACLGDPDPVADELGALLDTIELTPPDAAFPLARCPDPLEAWEMAAAVGRGMTPADRIVTRRPMVVEKDGGAFLTPTLVRVADPVGHALVGREFPFVFASVVAVDGACLHTLVQGSTVVRSAGPRPCGKGAAR